MGKFRTCSVNFKEKKEVFREGELVSGVTCLDVLEPVKVKGVRVYCYGEALTKWTSSGSRQNSTLIGQEKYFGQVITVFGKKVNEDGPHHTLTAGMHRWRFAFRLPAESLPSSFEGEHGAIRWFLKVEVDKPFPSINSKWYRTFTVLSRLDMNEPVYQTPQSKTASKTVSKALGLGNAGNLTLSAKTDRFGYCPGESIALTVEVKNESSKDMGKLTVTLVQRVVFRASDETKTTDLGLASMETEVSLAKGTTLSLTDLMLPIPAVPPSSRKRTCYIISCTYSVKVTVNVPWGLNLDTVIPVAIGTVPRGKRLPPPQLSAAQAAADPATNIQYAKCEVGIMRCTKSHNNFPNFPSTTYTAFVPNYSYPLGAATAAAVSAQGIAGKSQGPRLQPAPTPLASGEAARAKAAEAAASVVAAAGGTPGRAPLPPYCSPSAPPLGQTEPPPAYEDVLKMDEESQEASTESSPDGAVPKGEECAVPKGEECTVPKGEECAVMLVRFPDAFLASFRDCIQQEQNCLLDTEQAFLAALSPQPITGLERPNETWPERVAVAVLVFPDMRSGEEWLTGVSERGDNWYSSCAAVILPANWSVPQNADGRLILSMVVMETRENADKDRMKKFTQNVLPLFTKLRQDSGGERQTASRKVKSLHGQHVWPTARHAIALTYWPKLDNYFAYRDGLKKGEFPQHYEEFRALFDSYSLLLVSEDLAPLTTQPTLAIHDDDDRGWDSNDEEGACDDDNGAGKTENLLAIDEDYISA